MAYTDGSYSGTNKGRGIIMQEELQKLKEEFEERIRGLEIKYKTEGELEIKEGDNYWYVDGRGDIYNKQWEYDLFDGSLFEIGNVFKTKEEAEFAVEKLKVIKELKQLARPFKYGKDNHLIHYDYYAMKFEIFECITSQGAYGDYYFNSYDEAKEAVDKIGAERIKKYLFGVCE